MESKTYTKRVNARRAGVAAGIPSERVEITVHKNGDDVRFGWKENSAPGKAVVTTATPKAEPLPLQQVEQNGVKRPKASGVCAAVWGWLDVNPDATVKEVKAVAPAQGWNTNNVVCEFYSWRKFNGINGRAKAP